MIDLLTSAEAWAALLTLTALEIVLGIDNVIFLSVIVSRIPDPQAKRARQIGLALALVFRVLLLSLKVISPRESHGLGPPCDRDTFQALGAPPLPGDILSLVIGLRTISCR